MSRVLRGRRVRGEFSKGKRENSRVPTSSDLVPRVRVCKIGFSDLNLRE